MAVGTANNIGGIIAMELFDSEARYALDVEQVEAARDAGALVQLQVGLHYLAHANLPAGELDDGGRADRRELFDHRRDRKPAGRLHRAGAGGLPWPGRPGGVTSSSTGRSRTARANGQGRIVSFATYASAVLYNGIGRYALARDAAHA